MNICITYLPRDPRTEPNRAESPQLSRAGPQVPNRTETSRVPRSFELSRETSRAKLIGLSFESNPEPQVKPVLAESSTEVRFEPSRFPNKAEPVPDPESGLEPNRVSSPVSSRVPSLESSPSRSGA